MKRGKTTCDKCKAEESYSLAIGSGQTYKTIHIGGFERDLCRECELKFWEWLGENPCLRTTGAYGR